MTNKKVFVAHITLRHGEYETLTKRLILADDLASATQYANDQGMPNFNDGEPGEQYDAHGSNVWYFDCGDWAAKLDYVQELYNQDDAKIIAESGLISFL